MARTRTNGFQVRWPSKDIAETMAEKKRSEWEPLGAKYLGAEQEL